MNVIIWGCGQGGRTVKNWLPADARLLAFADSDPALQHTFRENVPVIPPEEIPRHQPDLVWIAVRNREAAAQIRQRLEAMGFSGDIRSLTEFCDSMDLRRACLRMLAQEIRSRKLPGEMAELGVYQGEFAREMNRLLPEKKLYLFDTFKGFPEEDTCMERQRHPGQKSPMTFQDTSLELVRSRLPYPEQAVFCPGRFPDPLAALQDPLPAMALVSLDPDLYEPVRQGLKIFWPLLVPGGMILIHDYNNSQFPGAGDAVREFCREHRLTVLPLPDLHGSGVLVKQE